MGNRTAKARRTMGDSCCGKSIDMHALHAKQPRTLIIVLTINAVTFAMMLAAAWFSRSSSLLSGGLDNFGDALTYALSLAVVGASTQAKARVVVFKGCLILIAAIAVGAQIAWRLANPAVPLFETMGAAALLNLAFNGLCLYLLTPYRNGDVNMASAWECSRNDVVEGLGVLAAAACVGLFGSGWPDLIIATLLLLMFLRSALRVFGMAWHGRQIAV
jgi:Co/Zn/Cd efflux system component